MEKTKEQLIETYKRANKVRRERMAVKAGFKTGAEYLESLRGGGTINKKPLKTAPKKEPKASKKELLDYIVAFDTTGSMNSYIGNVKQHVENLIPELFSNDVDLRMQIIAFGDYCDMRNGQFGNAYQQSAFTNNQSDLITFVKGAQSTSGGDTDEFYELVIKKITEETPWREGSKRSVLLIADDNPHKPGYSYGGRIYNIDWRAEAKQAALKGIAFDTLAIHGDSRPWYKELSKLTNGVYMPFQSSSKMAEVVTATMYARSGDRMSKEKFRGAAASASLSGDLELVGTYKSLATLLD